jgi:hypothetical protein
MDKLATAMKVVGKDDSKALKGEERSDSTVKQYLIRLVKLNNDKPFTNLKFLMDKDAIANVIKDKAESTKIGYYSAVIVALSTSKTYKKLKEEYQELVAPKREALKDKDVHEKTEKQKEAMMTCEEVTTIKNKLKEEIEELNKKKTLTEQEYDKYLYYVLVSLYTDIAPRRNMDYTYMVILKKRPSEMNNTKNYLLLDEKKFVFNTYKTKREYGSQEIDIPEQLMFTVGHYCKARADMKKFNGKSAEVPLLVHHNGKEVYRSNGITKLLNKVFGKNVACTALRHIYLSDKYADITKDKMKDATDMAHSITTQNEYIKF